MVWKGNRMLESDEDMPISSIVTPDFVGVILAGTPGARLYPLTVSEEEEEEEDDLVDGGVGEGEGDGGRYKHLLPVSGKPILVHLMDNLWECGLEHVIVTLSSKDAVTIPQLKETFGDLGVWSSNSNSNSNSSSSTVQVCCYKKRLNVRFVTLPLKCAGSAEALVVAAEALPKTFASPPLLVMPGDLILEPSSTVLKDLATTHRKGLPLTAATVLLSDVGEEDENGLPLKESSKAKKGGIAREDEDIEFIGISSSSSSSSSTTTTADESSSSNSSHHHHHHYRIMLKQSKYHVEEDEENTGNTPKLIIPKIRFHQANVERMTIRMDLSDVHVYALSSWVLPLLKARPSMKELQKELIPLLLSRQFRSKGIASAFPRDKKDLLDQVLAELEEKKTQIPNFLDHTSDGENDDDNDNHSTNDHHHHHRTVIPFSVSAHVLSRPQSKLTLRASTIPSYLYANREMVAFAVKSNTNNNNNNNNNNKTTSKPTTTTKTGTTSHKSNNNVLRLDSKNNSIIFADTTLGDKVQVKSCTVGKHVTIGNRCRLNNVVVMDHVVIGDNSILQNTVVSPNCTIGENCNLNDCQLGPGSSVASGTKSKAESFMKE